MFSSRKQISFLSSGDIERSTRSWKPTERERTPTTDVVPLNTLNFFANKKKVEIDRHQTNKHVMHYRTIRKYEITFHIHSTILHMYDGGNVTTWFTFFRKKSRWQFDLLCSPPATFSVGNKWLLYADSYNARKLRCFHLLASRIDNIFFLFCRQSLEAFHFFSHFSIHLSLCSTLKRLHSIWYFNNIDKIYGFIHVSFNTSNAQIAKS